MSVISADTIFAPATAAGRAGVAVLRLSGSKAFAAISALTRKPCPAPRLASLSRLYHPQTGLLLDVGLVLCFPAPHSFTGEDVAELQVHGSPAVLSALAEALAHLGLRLAEPGEFSRRAFVHGRMDLTEVEALADLLAAQTEAQRQQALRQMQGELAALYDTWRQKLLRLLAHAEAEIDFPDEDLPGGLSQTVAAGVAELASQIKAHLADARRGEKLRTGLHVAIIGAPNVGKSSLLNALAQRPAAIVSPLAGTTRDVIEVWLDIAGYPVTLADTAGLRATDDQIEHEGVSRALAISASADIRLLLFAVDQPISPEMLAHIDEKTIIILNKADMLSSNDLRGWQNKLSPHSFIAISAQSGQGIDVLLTTISTQLSDIYTKNTQPSLTRERHRLALQEALSELEHSLVAPAAELAAEHLRLAMRVIGRIMGQHDVEDLLDVIFRDFCIGK